MEASLIKIGKYWLNLDALCWAEIYDKFGKIELGLIYGNRGDNRLQLQLSGEEAQKMIQFLESKQLKEL